MGDRLLLNAFSFAHANDGHGGGGGEAEANPQEHRGDHGHSLNVHRQAEIREELHDGAHQRHVGNRHLHGGGEPREHEGLRGAGEDALNDE